MLSTGRRYPTFILPLSRGTDPSAPEASTREEEAQKQAYEFFILQWAQHEAPPVPTYESETSPFPLPSSAAGESNPPTSTVLYAPLAEYKMRQAFATPHLLLTFHTELARTHGIVLLRGELTPTGSGDAEGNARYWLSQEDAQLLALGLQKFYLWQGEGAGAREELLKAFHERPADFKWGDLLQHAQPV
jgi:ATP synthase mitochondrial F1 complex assembly factor 1